MTHGDEKVEGVKPRTCGHAFVLAGTCKECARYVAELRAARGKV